MVDQGRVKSFSLCVRCDIVAEGFRSRPEGKGED